MLPLSALLTDASLASLPPAEIERGVFMALLHLRLMAPGTPVPQVVTDWFDSQLAAMPPVLDRFAATPDHFPAAAEAWRRLGHPQLANALDALPLATDEVRASLAADIDARLLTLADFHLATLRANLDAFRQVPDLDPASVPSFLRPPADRPDVLTLLADEDAGSDLEDAVWLTVCARAGATLPDDPIVRDWFVTRLLLWEAMNGGAAQVAVNVGGLLDDAVAAWRRADKPEVADAYQAIADARATLPEDASYDEALPKMAHLDEPLFVRVGELETFHVDWIRRERAAFIRYVGG